MDIISLRTLSYRLVYLCPVFSKKNLHQVYTMVCREGIDIQSTEYIKLYAYISETLEFRLRNAIRNGRQSAGRQGGGQSCGTVKQLLKNEALLQLWLWRSIRREVRSHHCAQIMHTILMEKNILCGNQPKRMQQIEILCTCVRLHRQKYCCQTITFPIFPLRRQIWLMKMAICKKKTKLCPKHTMHCIQY